MRYSWCGLAKALVLSAGFLVAAVAAQPSRWPRLATVAAHSQRQAGPPTAALTSVPTDREPLAHRQLPALPQGAASPATSLSQAFRSAARRVVPAVVTIRHTVPFAAITGKPNKGQKRSPLDDFDRPPVPKQFFHQPPDSSGANGVPELSLGSGVIIDPSGTILTNNHVVEGGGRVVVELNDRREFTATETSTDPATDLAILKIHADRPLPYARLGDSDQMEIGDWVIAVGDPFGLSETVTAGIISAKQRGLGITSHDEFLQTDAAINPGNSGGPLVNLDGQVIGINTAISSTSGTYQGVGFAVPANLARWVASQLRENGRVRRAYLGIGIQQLTPELAAQLGIEQTAGVLISDVFDGSPASQAGLKTGDIITDFAGTRFTETRQLQNAVERSAIGSTQPIKIIRGRQPMRFQAAVREQPSDFDAESAGDEYPADGLGDIIQIDQLGLAVSPLSDALRKQWHVRSAAALVVTDVQPGGPADQAGLTVGAIIIQIGNTPVASPEALKASLGRSSSRKSVLLRVQTKEGTRFVVVDRP